ncbi:MAG TPA: HAMP domain-containing protein [Polyangiaceae bacterium]
MRGLCNGDFSVRLATSKRKDDALNEIAAAFNQVAVLNERLSNEMVRLERVVGREGRMNERASIGAVRGGWETSIGSINALIGDLVQPTTEVARVISAVADGDLTQKMALEIEGQPVKGEFLRIGTTVNAMVDQLSAFSSEVTRVAKEVGTDGKLGGQAKVAGVSGTWKELTDNVNQLANNLTAQVRNIAEVTTAVAKGDLSRKITVDAKGEVNELKNTVNTMVDQLRSFAAEVTRVAREVGTEGKLGGQAEVRGVSGVWQDLTNNVNLMASNLTDQVRNIATVTTAVANGDLSKKITVDVKGEILELKVTINTMVDQLNAFAAEVTRVAREVGTEGKLGGQAEVKGAAGTWKDLTDNVNFMASNLTSQVRGIARVVTAVANGDLSQRFKVDAKGEIAQLADTINNMTDTLGVFAQQVTDVARTVGVDGILGAQAVVPGVAGTWKDLTDNVNLLANNLTAQVRNIAEVTTAVARGDLSKKITVDARGEVLALKNTINTMVDQLNSFAAEVTRVAKEVGTEGRLGGQAEVAGVSGTWKELTDNVNLLAANLTVQVRNIAEVTTAVANGDLSRKITVDARGEVNELKNTVNIMVDQLRSFAAEVTRVAKEVGTEGKLGGQAQVPGVSGTWKDLTDNVNVLAGNLTDQVRNIAKVTTAVANGDLSQKITVEARGEILELKNTINTMVDQLRSFAAEVTRVAKEVGTEGKLGGQAEVQGVSGTWKDLTDNVNFMASNLTSQVRNIALVTTAVAKGDLSKKITVDVKGEILELKNTINTMVDQLNSFASEVTRVAKEVGTEGRLGGQAEVQGVAGVWKALTDNVNTMAQNLTTQVRGIVKVVTAVANGDLKQKLAVDAKGEVAALAETINNMTDTLGTFADQVSNVAREVGVEGKLGGQAKVPGVAGTWKDLTDNVNFMASNLTTQVRGIVRVVTAVANGDLKQKLFLDAKGEVAALVDTINAMTDTLGTFAEQVTTVAREVGVEGKLGGQAKVPGAKGTWRQLTDNVNQLAANLTTQVRAISDVATAVTAGDLTRSITVEAEGELAALKATLNQMITNLRETTEKNTEQDWLKTNLARFSSMMQGGKNLEEVSRLIMSELTPLVSAHHGAFFMMDTDAGVLHLTATYAYKERKHISNRFRLGESLVGQCALEKKSILLTKVPTDYIQINSGLGEATPLNLIVLPVLFEGEIRAVIELASFHPFSQIHQIFLDQLTESIGVVLNMIMANMRTEELLMQSQKLTQELQNQSTELTQQQEQLKRTNVALEKQALELEEKARQLEEQNQRVEIKNREVEQARASLEEKAEQLALISKYKSEFLANMSHELRTPLNSLLILAKLLSDNKDANLSEKQIEYAKTIYASGGELLSLINEILDLSKVEAGKMQVEPRDIELQELSEFARRNFGPLAEQKNLEFQVNLAKDAPETVRTDPQRLQQVIKNLLANAFKFTERGRITLDVGYPKRGERFSSETLRRARRVISISVIDTGIGIPKDKQQLIFEAFQQADGTTSRKYGGTGLGLSISREITRLLGGEIHVESEPGKGSRFTLYLPDIYVPIDSREAALPQLPAVPEPPRQPPPAHVDTTVMTPSFSVPIIQDRPIEDDRHHIREGDRVLLVIEDDLKFAKIMLDMARDQGFKVVIETRGDAGLATANELLPDAITLDIQLPVIHGWSLLDRLKRNPRTRHIPVHVISVVDDRLHGASLGAFAYLEKPVSREALDGAFAHICTLLDREVRRLLVIEDDATQQKSIIELLGDGKDVEITAVATAEEALRALDTVIFDAIVFDLILPDTEGLDLLAKIRSKNQDLPIIVYTGKELSSEEEKQLKLYAQSIILKSEPSSPGRLIDDSALFLHRVVKSLSPRSQEAINAASGQQAVLNNKKVLVVDDDIRNIFAITSVLESFGMTVTFADNGKSALKKLHEIDDIDIILMDVMMPEMDGYDAIRAIRQNQEYQALPIIAVTAKALKDDRAACVAAGASDYLAKPVDTDKLLELMRLWLRR